MDASSPAGPLPGAYAPPAATFDEMLDGQGGIRPSWRALLDHLASLGSGELARRWEKAQHLIQENGVSYNVYGDPQGLERPWSLSPLPVLVSSEDWGTVTLGLEQRARLLAALLADLYGPQRSITEGRLPPEIVFAHPAFLRAVHGMAVPDGNRLPLYAADLVRRPSGGFSVVEDCTQVPSGAGYALENRIVISRTLPEVFRDSRVERLALFFRALRDALAALAPHNRDNPRIVLLTPGPFHATYFEHAYLAQYLGLTLVNGGDLTVRDDRVYLKTLGGLQQVDVIVRRVNDDFCDPLELRPDSVLGVPGLVQAARAGNVAIASPLGSGVAQIPALLPFLPSLCRQLLREELELPSIGTWWCGEPAGLAETLARIDDVVLRPALPDGDSSLAFTALLSRAERDDLVAAIRARPSAFVAQERAAPSTTPEMDGGALVPRSLVLRCYAVAAPGGRYRFMPGGLARVAEPGAKGEVSMQLGARSKDVWVLSREAPSDFSLLPPPQGAVRLSRGGGDLPSRAADNLYWLGRYAERAEGATRLARVLGARLADVTSDQDLARSSEFGALFSALRAQTEFLVASDIPVERTGSLAECEARLAAAVYDPSSTGSVASIVKSTLGVARVARDRLSRDTWRVLATLDEEVRKLEGPRGPETLSTLVNALSGAIVTLAGFSGLVMESMTRGQAWQFLDMGRRIERAIALVTLLRATTTRVLDREGPLLDAVLDIADSGMTYRRRYLATLQVAPVVDLLLTDDGNPRSVLFQIRALVDDIRVLPKLPGAGVRSPQLRQALVALNELELAEVEDLCVADPDGHRPRLDATLRRVGAALPALHESLSNGYLSHATTSRTLRNHAPPPQPGGAGSDGP